MKKAKWIWIDNENRSNEFVEYKSDFNVVNIQKTYIDISVAGDYNLYVNNKFVSFGQYADYGYYKVYDRIDITDYIIVGQNNIKIVAWYIGKSVSTFRDFGSGLIYELVCGDNILCYSSKKTKCNFAQGYVSHLNKMITLQLGFSYKYDFNDVIKDETHAVEVNGFGNDLIIRPNKKLQLKEILKGKLIDKDKRLYDLGKEVAGFLSFKIKGKHGENFTIAYGEHIVDGGVRSYIDGRDFTVDFIASGNSDEFVGSFRRLGCQFLQIKGDVEVEYIGICQTEYPFNEIPCTIENKLQRNIYDVSINTLKLCYHEHYEDCPWREQSMYIMDSRNQMRCGYYAFDNPECALSSIRLIRQGQKENGLYELCFPADVPITILSFSLTYVSMVKEYAEYSKDTSIISECYGSLQKMLDYFISKLDSDGVFKTISEDGIWHFYEWAGELDGAFFSHDGSKKFRNEYDVLINAFLSIALSDMSILSTLLKNFEKTFYYKDLQQKLNKGIKQKFFSEGTGLFRTYDDREEYSELANALCILCDVAKGDIAEKIADKLAGGYDNWVENSISMNLFRYDALLKVSTEKYKQSVLDDIEKTYGYMLKCGATSFWETIEGEAAFAKAGSLCHGWSAIPVYYYHILGVCGIEEKPLNNNFSYYGLDCRKNSLDSTFEYINKLSYGTEKDRDKTLALPYEERKKIFEEMLGTKVTKFSKVVVISKEKIIQNQAMLYTRYIFKFDDVLTFSGIMYENIDRQEKEKLIFALHGGGGSPEIIGNLFLNSANYNDMVDRVIRKGVKVFAPQLLMWNDSTYGFPFDRGIINRRLIQLGSSLTALELNVLSGMIDYFEKQNDIEISSLGVLGLSYGGMYALNLGAYDSRVKFIYSSCWFSDRKKHNWHDWTYFNAEHKMFDAEVASLVFPRQLFVETANNDGVFPSSDGEEEKQRLLAYAKKTGNLSNLHIKNFDGIHELDKDSTLLNEFVDMVINTKR